LSLGNVFTILYMFMWMQYMQSKKNRSLKISNLSAIAPSPSDPTRHFHVDMIRDIIRDILIILGHLIIKEYY
jgi:hypothetical protein